MNHNGVEQSRGKEKVVDYKRKRKDNVVDDRCFFCKDGGRLMFCDQKECLKAYHPSCVNKDDSFPKSGVHWTCDVHSCIVCHKIPNLSCLTCPKSLCKGCIGSIKFVQIKGEKGFCSSCLSLALQIEGNNDAVFDMPYESHFARAWMVLSKKEHITLEDLSSADDRMKKNICYISGFNSDVDAEHVKKCKGKTPMVKRNKYSLQNKNPSAVAAEREPELARVKQEAEVEGTGIYLGDRGIAGRDASARCSEFFSENNVGIGYGKNYSATAKVIEGDRSIMVQDASQHLKVGSLNNDGIREENDPDADGGQGIMAQDTSQCLQIGSSNNDGIGKGNDNNDAAANVTKGDQVLDQTASSKRTKRANTIEIVVVDDDATELENPVSPFANVTEGDQVLDQTASSKRIKRANTIEIVVVDDDATELENPVSPFANVTEGNKDAEESGLTLDKQAEAILKTRPERHNSGTEVLDEPNFTIKDEDFEWNVIVSEDGSVKGPYPLHSLKCLQDIYAVSSFLKVFKKGESTETAIPLGDALKLFSIRK